MSKPVRSPSESVEAICDKAAEVRHVSQKLAERITQFQDYLGKLPGRVETKIWRSHPDAPDGSDNLIALRLHREGKAWVLSWGNDTESNDKPIEWRPLVDAPLKVKLASVKMFPDLLGSIEKSQTKLIDEIVETSAEYDSFAHTLKLTPIKDEGSFAVVNAEGVTTKRVVRLKDGRTVNIRNSPNEGK